MQEVVGSSPIGSTTFLVDFFKRGRPVSFRLIKQKSRSDCGFLRKLPIGLYLADFAKNLGSKYSAQESKEAS